MSGEKYKVLETSHSENQRMRTERPQKFSQKTHFFNRWTLAMGMPASFTTCIVVGHSMARAQPSVIDLAFASAFYQRCEYAKPSSMNELQGKKANL